MEKGLGKPLASPCKGLPPPKPTIIGRAYVMSRKEAISSGMVIIEALFLNLKSFYVLFNSGATYSFISSQILCH